MDSDDRPSAKRKRRQFTPEQLARFAKLSNGSRELIERFADRLEPEVLADYRSFSDVGEWTLLVDNLCATLVKRKILVSPAERDALAELLALFGDPKDNINMSYIDDYQRVLEELNVLPKIDVDGEHL
ncbi:MafI family immunity protein [Nocardia sp. NPDC055002]